MKMCSKICTPDGVSVISLGGKPSKARGPGVEANHIQAHSVNLVAVHSALRVL